MCWHIAQFVQQRDFGRAPTASRSSRLMRKSVMLALANRAHRDGSNIFASVQTLAKLSSCSDRAVRNALSEFESEGLIRNTGKTAYGTNTWQIDLMRLRLIKSALPNEKDASFAPQSVGRQPVPNGTARSAAKQRLITSVPVALDVTPHVFSRERQVEIERLCIGFDDVISPDREEDVWALSIDNFKAKGLDFETEILPGVRKFFRIHRQRRQRGAATWEPIRSLAHPGIAVWIEKIAKRARASR